MPSLINGYWFPASPALTTSATGAAIWSLIQTFVAAGAPGAARDAWRGVAVRQHPPLLAGALLALALLVLSATPISAVGRAVSLQREGALVRWHLQIA